MFKRLIKKWWQSAVIGTILGVLIVFGIFRYQTDQDAIHDRISELQRQQEIVLMSNLPALIKKVAPSVVYVKADQWSGSGVIVGPSIVLTARHVVQNVESLEIETVDGNVYKAISWIEDKENDCGLIFFDPRIKFTNIAKFANSDELQIGQSVFTMGSPYGKQLFNTATFGIISGLNRQIRYFGTCGLITSDAATNPGNSGGPVFDIEGKVIGIIVGSKYGADGLGVIVPSNICKGLLENVKSD